MSKKSLVDNFQAALASEANVNLTKEQVRDALKTLSGVVLDEIQITGKVKLEGIVTLRLRDVAERSFVSSMTGKTTTKPAHQAVKARSLVDIAA